MTAEPVPFTPWKRLRWLAAGACLALALGTGAVAMLAAVEPTLAPSAGEKMAALRDERAALQARAGGIARLELLTSFRAASLLTDALGARHDLDPERPFEQLPAVRRQAFADLDTLNATLREALARPGEGTRLGAATAEKRVVATLERLAETGDDLPVVLSVTPRYVPPSRGTGEMRLAPGRVTPPVSADAGRDALPLGATRGDGSPPSALPGPTQPLYVPEFAPQPGEDPPVIVEIVGLRLSAPGEPRPVLSVGGWRGAAELRPERLVFSVPRAAFGTQSARTELVNAALTIRRNGRSASFQLALLVLPERPGYFAFDQRVRATELETNTLVSPEILARAGAGETRTMRRCFDPPEGWRFDKPSRRVIIVERLGWIDDVADPSLNGGTVEFALDEPANQICFSVVARPQTKAARTATIGRFEVTLVRDKAIERAVRSGIRALDWNEAVRLPLEPNTIERRLYIRLFDEIDYEFLSVPAGHLPFLSIVEDAERQLLVLRAHTALEPK